MIRFYRFIFWPAFFFCHLLAISLLSWHLLAQFHFGYPLGYRLLNLDQHIAEYAPLNKHRKGFELTSQQTHWQLFGEISDAVQNEGKGLEEIRYSLPNGETISLMHQAEITHLQDVANLIDKLYAAGIFAGLVWLGFLLWAFFKKLVLPPIKHILLGFLTGLLLLTGSLFIFNPTKVFYWLHTKVFPDENQWFFYYEDSLMTTLMKAPDIFAFIGGLLGSLVVLFWLVSLWGMTVFLKDVTQKTLSIEINEKTHKSKTKKKSVRKKR